MARAFFSGHNYQINLDENQDGTEHYHQMFAFLRQSRIHHVLSHAPVICEPYLIEFWSNARYLKRDDGEVIRTRVVNHDIEFGAEDLRIILNLGTIAQEGDAEGLTVFDRSIISGGLRRMGFSGNMTKSTLFKKGFFGRWRYLAHVLLVGLSNKKTGWDTLNQETQAQLVGIVYNKPYSFSKFFFNEFRKQISARGTTRFLMYPRFVMMILNARLPNLPVVEPVKRVTSLIKRSYNEFLARNANDPNAQDVELFGAVVNINYATPSDEAIASFEDLPAAVPQPQQQQHQHQQQQQQPQPDVTAQQLNVMLDEQAVNPLLAQAVIHEVLQELAPVDDSIADTEAYHDVGVSEDQVLDDDDSSSSSSDDSDDDDSSSEEEKRPQIVRKGSKMVSTGGSSSGSKRKEIDDLDYYPEGDDMIETPPAKKMRSIESESLTAKPSSSKIDVLEDKLSIMEALVKSMNEEMKKQQVTHAREVDALNKKNERLEQVVTQLAQRVDENRVRADAVERDHSKALAKLQVKVGVMDDFSKRTVNEASSMAQHIHAVLDSQHQGIIQVRDFAEKLDQAVAFLGSRIDVQATCRDDPLKNVGREDRDDDPDMTRQGKMPSIPLNLVHQASTFKGESSREGGHSAGPSGEPKEADIEVELEAAVGDTTGFNNVSSSYYNLSSSSSSDHDNLIREIQMKFGHDRMLAENVYADLMEKRFQEESINELSQEYIEQNLNDSYSSSDSEYVPEKDK